MFDSLLCSISVKMSLSDVVQKAIVNANYDFEKVIADVADGFKRCRFFDQPEWKNKLQICFERINLGLTTQEIQIYMSVMSDSSYEDGFANGLNAVSTPNAVAQNQRENRTIRKRSSTTTKDTTTLKDVSKRMKRPLDGYKVANILVDMKNTDWDKILPGVNAQQNTVKYVTVFEKSKQLKPNYIATGNSSASKDADAVPSSTVDRVDQAQAFSSRNTIKKRRNAIYRPSAKVKRPSKSVSAGLPASEATNDLPNPSKVAKGTDASTLLPTVSTNNAVVETNITGRRMTRRQTILMAAYSGATIGTSERRNTNIFYRTSVLFTMIDILPFKNVLTAFNIFVAETNEKYDYLIAEKICRSPKFMSALVAGKPIVSIGWIDALKEQNIWLDPLQYLLNDTDGETEYNFKLAETLQLATNKKLFEKYSILVTPNIAIGPDLLKDVIFSGGGKCLKTTLVPRRGDTVICVSDERDKKMWPRLHEKYPDLKHIISLDGFASMIFKYTHDVKHADILRQF